MKRFLLLPLLLILTTCNPVYAGYSVYIAPLIPEFVTVNGPYGPELWPNRQEPSYPVSYGREICRPADYSPYAAEPARRTIVFEDYLGEASSSELFAACPQIRTIKEAEIRAEGARQLTAMATPYSAAERETWATQQREARSWQANHNADVPMIFAMASVRGLTIEEMVALIMENVELFEFASGYILGQQQRLLDQITAATDFNELLAISW